MQLPVLVKLPAGAGEEEVLAVTKDVSARGVFIYLDLDAPEKTPIEFTLTLPPEVTMTQSIRVHCLGQIVRIQRSGHGKEGIATMIHHYRFLDSEAS
jgi:hypothetical protein